MKVRIQVVIEDADGQVQDVQEVFQLERGELKPETLGLNLAEGKKTLQGVQRVLATRQVEQYVEANRCCRQCGQTRRRKGQHELVYRTLFGRLEIESPRLYECGCPDRERKSFSPVAELLPERTAPELLFLEAKWASLIPFHATSELMAEILPLGHAIGTTSLRRNLRQVAERMEKRLGAEKTMFLPADPDKEAEGLPDPKPPMEVGLDGGYVHSCEREGRRDGWFEVIVGRSEVADGAAKRFAFVSRFDEKPKRRVFELLTSQGLHSNQPVTFLSDGGETVRNLPMNLNPLAEHLLDWFHLAMRFTVMGQMNKGMSETPGAGLMAVAEKQLESIKHHLWNGNVGKALALIDVLRIQLEGEHLCPGQQKLLTAVQDLAGYVTANQDYIPDYGDRYRNGETITTSFVESAVNQVVSKRMVKKQQMRWSMRGAHLLLQVRTEVLNRDLRKTFQEWYPRMAAEPTETRLAA